ncbi:MAG: DUF4007 family protein [Candidatus Electrothrix sp. LOE1_4_5]|nr:DUF4007 family protein [Candidatus Electrothrix gigas]
MEFSHSKVAFNRHESFSLRFGWLTKGFKAFQDNPDFFSAPDAVVQLGVGKNMVNSIRHWLRAAQLVEINNDQKRTTRIGEAIFDRKTGYDPYLEDEATIWLIHWLLATNPIHATSWYWFFNRFYKPEFTSQEVYTALIDFSQENITGKYSANSIKNDSAVLLRTYVQSRENSKIPAEEALDSPLSLLKLITYTKATKTYQSRLIRRDGLPIGILGYALADLFRKRKIKELSMENLVCSCNGQVAPGPIFRLSENDLIAKLEDLVYYLPNIFKTSDSAGIHQLYLLQDIDPLIYIDAHYKAQQQGKTA